MNHEPELVECSCCVQTAERSGLVSEKALLDTAGGHGSLRYPIRLPCIAIPQESSCNRPDHAGRKHPYGPMDLMSLRIKSPRGWRAATDVLIDRRPLT